MTKKTLLSYALVAFLSLSIGAGLFSETKTIEKEVIKEVPVAGQTIEVDKNQATWEQLKTIDDRGFVLAGEGMTSCSRAFQAIADSDLDGMNTEMENLKKLNSEIGTVAAARQETLGKLGY